MEENLRAFLGLLSHDQLARKEASPSYVFKKMFSAEPSETYLKDATSNLGTICESLERSQVGTGWMAAHFRLQCLKYHHLPSSLLRVSLMRVF